MTLFDTISARRGTNTLLMNLMLVVAGSLLMTIAAKVQVPFYPVPMSMQTFVAIGLGLALGPVRGTAAVLFYLAQGSAGLPVFAGTPQQGIGLAYMVGPTGGFLAGFALVAFVAGLFSRIGFDRNPVTAMAAALVAGFAIYLPGLAWLGLFTGYGETLLAAGLYPFILGDVAKALLAALVFPAAWKWVAADEAR
jgi:biotin transport system substrate-specific component